MNKVRRFTGFFLFFVLLSSLMVGCDTPVNTTIIVGSGTLKAEARPVLGVTSVTFSMSGNLQIAQGDQDSLEVEAEDNLLGMIRTEVRNGNLLIDSLPGTSFRATKQITFRLTLRSIERLEFSSSGSIEASALEGKAFTMNAHGSGAVVLESLLFDDLAVMNGGSGSVAIGKIQAGNLTISMTGSGSCQINGGQAAVLNLSISGSGSLKAGELAAGSASATLSASGGGTIWVKDALTANLSGSGSLSYYGNPQGSQNASGSGRIQRLGEK